MILMVAEAVATNINLLFEAVKLRYHLPMPMPRLVVEAQVVDHISAQISITHATEWLLLSEILPFLLRIILLFIFFDLFGFV